MRRHRRWWPDLVLGAVVAAVGTMGAVLSLTLPGRDRTWPVVFAVLSGLLLVAARRYPWPVLVTEAVLLVAVDTVQPFATDTAQLSLLVPLCVLAYSAGWVSTVLGFLLVYAATLVNVIDPGNSGVLEGGQGIIRLIMLGGGVATPVVFGRYLSGLRGAARVAEERLREAEQRRTIETNLARLAERASIARDLHDIVAHHIGAIALQAGAAQFAVSRGGRLDEAERALGDIRGAAGQVLDELRELLEVLRDPEAVEPAGLLVDLEQVVTDAAARLRAAGLTVRVDIDPAATATPLVIRTTAARVVQEGLTNALKHAGPGATVAVDVRRDDDALVVQVRDSGPRAAPDAAALPPSGHGLAGVRERVGLLGGTLVAGPARPGGWRLQVRLPVEEP